MQRIWCIITMVASTTGIFIAALSTPAASLAHPMWCGVLRCLLWFSAMREWIETWCFMHLQCTPRGARNEFWLGNRVVAQHLSKSPHELVSFVPLCFAVWWRNEVCNLHSWSDFSGSDCFLHLVSIEEHGALTNASLLLCFRKFQLGILYSSHLRKCPDCLWWCMLKLYG